MLFDLVFFACPIILAICLGAHAIREEDARFWQPTFALTCLLYFLPCRRAGSDLIYCYRPARLLNAHLVESPLLFFYQSF